MTGSDPSSWTLRREARDSDADAVRRLVTVTGFFSAAEIEIAGELVLETLADPLRSDYHFLFADDARGEVVGYSCSGPIPMTQGSWDLYWIAVDPACQGAGMGRQLLAECEQHARSAGARKLFVDTSGQPRYAPTRAFYESCGYTVAAVLEDFYAPGDSKVIFHRHLGQGPPTACGK